VPQSALEHEFIYHGTGFAALLNVNAAWIIFVSRPLFSAGFSRKELEIRCAAARTARYAQIPGICMLRYILHFTYGKDKGFQTHQTTILKPMNNRDIC